MDVEHISQASLAEIKAVFIGLQPAALEPAAGFYRAQFVGPWWLRHSAGPSLAMSGLSGWEGKKFFDDGTATNILNKKGQISEKFQMHCMPIRSTLDDRSSVALEYGEEAPIPWRWIKDEIRVLNQDTFLCMTVIHLPLLEKLAFPFVLIKEG